ncbi:hypothetical protein SAMN06269185_1299 [Natronoarchaeum philippinense]|uniref:HTTM domain-containing protein n=1 Tax=Natronoarchaeum philippinense TaxID=558529 RepID=A0A285ND50_NATPI|nr:hypothetical protein [Natronoarchaeum philippinense]SNZ06823.1 hypothetical protein SAMN06269185_1299 [Natronoarchaeum philippinense]
MIESTVDPAVILQITAIALSMHIVLTSLEHLRSRERFTDGGMLSWEVTKLHLQRNRVADRLAPLLRNPYFQWMLVARLLVGLALGGLAVTGNVSPFLLAPVVVLDIAIALRHQGGLSGDYHIATVVAVGLLVASAASPGSTLQLAGLLFIAVQSILSYLIAGLSKLVSTEWRDGSAIVVVFSTRVWGHGGIYNLANDHPRLSQLLSVSVIAFESLFPLVLIVDPVWTLGFFVAGFVFHLATALFMRLNGFLIAFPATYPAVFYANDIVRSWLF